MVVVAGRRGVDQEVLENLDVGPYGLMELTTCLLLRDLRNTFGNLMWAQMELTTDTLVRSEGFDLLVLA